MSLTVDAQLRVLGKIWGRDRDGYVFLPWINGTARTTRARRDSYHEGRAYKWPSEEGAIAQHLADHTDDDVYFTPALFNAKRRIEQNVDAERTLWADLDPVDPSSLGDLKPTIAWETSPGRYQGVWLLNTPKTGASWPSQENHRLTMAIGADPSGWDSTQLLRVPGRRNHKPAYGEAVDGELLWDNGPRYVWSDFDELPEIATTAATEDLFGDQELLDSVDRYEAWSRLRMGVSHRVREFMSAKEASGDRSAVLWEICRELATAGATALEIIALVRPSVWNKYSGRNDEIKRLKITVAKALAERESTPLEEVSEGPKPDILWLNDVLSVPIPRPRWLVKDIWTEGGCGFIAGAPKSYKSYLALDLAVSVATGTPFLNRYPTTQRPVLYLQEEDDLRLVNDRLEQILDYRAPERFWHGHLVAPMSHTGEGTNVAQQVFWEPPEGDTKLAPVVQRGFIASDPGWQDWLEAMVAEHDFGLVVIDTLGTTAGDIDTDRATDVMQKMLIPLKQIAKKHMTAISIVHHNRKPSQNGTRAGNEMLGSVALHAWVDCALYARAKDSDSIVTVEREAKLSPDTRFRIKIPFMFKTHHNFVENSRQLWDPEFQDERVDEPSSTPKAEKGTAGKRLAIKLKMCGGGPMPVDRLESIIGNKVGDQLSAAISNGFIIRDPDGRIRVGEGVG